MLLLVSILLHYVTLTSTRSLVNFYSASDHAIINENRPAVARFSPTLAPAAADDTSLNVPHPIAADTVTGFGHNTQPNAMTGILDRIGNDVGSRKLPILRVEIDTIKSPDSPPPAGYAPHNKELSPQHEVLRGAEAPSVDRNDEKGSEPDVVFSNNLAHVEVIPSDAVPVITPSTPTTAPTTALIEPKKDFLEEAITEEHVGKESELDGSLKESGHVMELVEHGTDELPSPKTLLLDDRKPKIISSISIVELSNGSAFVEDMGKESSALGSQVQDKFEPKSIEDEDNDAFNELDEKSEADLEFHDDADLGTKPAAEERLPTSSTTPTTRSSSTKVEEPMTDEEIFDLLMYLVMLLPHVEKSETSVWSKIIAGLQIP